jgi:hypothetical protein
VWFDPPHSESLAGLRRGRRHPRSVHAVRLVGGDPLMVATEHNENGCIPGWATVEGTWLGDFIQVLTQTSTPPASARRAFMPQWVTPPCAPPEEGWPAGSQDELVTIDMRALRDADNCVTTVVYRPRPDSVVMVVTAVDVAEAERVWRPVLGSRLCVVQSRWSKRQLEKVRADLRSQWDDWTISSFGSPVGEDGQTYVAAKLLRVTPDLAAWARDIPEGLFEVDPTLHSRTITQLPECSATGHQWLTGHRS